ncbi:MAG: cysteine desulfurase [Oscillospiraceae bacterium]|jgi:cysteine desulfurase|nr:cysteine desulfurase [Oscillospiraceae bacterium]
MIYLDSAATTRTRREAAEAALDAMTEDFGNPSSTYKLGRDATLRLTEARASVASLLRAEPDEVYFTSGGTEADNWAVLGTAEARKRRGSHIITSLAEHSAVLRAAEKLATQGFEVTFLRPQRDGTISPADFAAAIREDTILASLMLVNNETGAINPVAECAAELKQRAPHALFHTDAVQAFGKIPLSVKALGVDLASVSAHKIYGAKGAGALYIRDGVKLPPLILGGSQENSLRGGTQNTPTIAAFGVAAALAEAEFDVNYAHAQSLKALAIAELTARIPTVELISTDAGSPHILSLSLPGHHSETLMTALEEDEIYVSRSSACKAGAASHVLQAMDLPVRTIDGALRVSFSRVTTEDEVRFFAEKLQIAAETLFTRR